MDIKKVKLEPMIDARKSFYNKAHVITKGDVKQLQSYNTIVAEIKDNKAEIFGIYSATTLRHIKDFLYQNGFEIGSKSELEKMYMN